MDEENQNIIKSVFHPGGYQVFHLTMPYIDSEGKLLFFINTEKYKGDVEKQLLLQNGFIKMLHELSELKLRESQNAKPEPKNVGIKVPLTHFLEDETNGYSKGYNDFWAEQPIRPEGLEQLCWLKEDWWGGHDSWLYIKNDKHIEYEFLNKAQAGLLGDSINYIGEKLNEERLKAYTEIWAPVFSVPFRNILKKTFDSETKNWKIYKNFDKELIKLLDKCDKLVDLMKEE